MTHKEQILEELENCYDKNFTVPEGMYIPYGQNILVRECTQEEFKTEAGLIMVKSKNLRHARIGVVYRIGEGVYGPLKIGMTVAFDIGVEFGVVYNGVTYFSINEHQVHAIVPPKNYLMPHVADTEENRRGDRIDRTKRIISDSNEKADIIQNGTFEDFKNAS